ncbi:MAG: SRPBCC family protein [Nocardioidaceae bacterium]
MTSTVSRLIDGTPAAVWDILSDGWLYGLWVVGASGIRDVEGDWPSVGAAIHHSVGTWPLLLDDLTTVLSSAPQRELELRARAWPTGEATVRITLEGQGAQTLVTIVEDATRGPATLIPSPVRRAALDRRNSESLKRLSYLVKNKAPVTDPRP